MQGRNIKVDTKGNEWMNPAQFTRAMLDDFDIKLTQTVVSVYRTQGKFPKTKLKNISGKDCINYTQTIVQFISDHARNAPANFKKLLADWKKKQDKKALKTIPKNVKIEEKDLEHQDDEEFATSVVLEKALHEKVKREKAEFEFKIMKGQYIHMDDLIPALETIAIETRQSVKAMIPRLAPLVTACVDLNKNKRLLEKETDIALNHIERIGELTDGSFIDKESKKQEKEMENET